MADGDHGNRVLPSGESDAKGKSSRIPFYLMAPKTPQWILTTKPTKQLAAHSDAAELILDFKVLQRDWRR
jgi:hypothetical protein